MSDEIVFKGTDRSEALSFISAIRKKALANGKQRNFEWMADIASGCFEDEAAAWYESLDIDDQQDWKRLGRELLKQWPTDLPGGPPIAAAVLGQGSAGPQSAQVSGVIKVITDKGCDYLSRTLDTGSTGSGYMMITNKVDEAVRVTFRHSDAVHEIVFERDFPEYPLLGFHFSDSTIDVYSESNRWAYLCPYQSTSMGSVLLPEKLWNPRSGHRVAPSRWRVEKDGTMRPYVMDDDTYKSRELDVMLNRATKSPFITHHPPSYLKCPDKWTSAQLIFQPC